MKSSGYFQIGKKFDPKWPILRADETIYWYICFKKSCVIELSNVGECIWGLKKLTELINE